MKKPRRCHPMIAGLAEAKLAGKEDDYLNSLNRKGRRSFMSTMRKAKRHAPR